MGKRKSDAETKRPATDDLALLSNLTVKGQPLGSLSVAKQKKLLEILSTDLKNTGPTSAHLDFESFRMGFLTASVMVRMFICTGGGEAYDDIVKRLEAAD